MNFAQFTWYSFLRFFLSFVFLWLLLPIARVGWHVPACLVQFSRHGPPSLKTKLFFFVFCPILTMIRPYLSARCSIGVFVTTQDLKRIFSCLLQYHHWQSERRLHQDDGVENGVIWPRHSQSYQTRPDSQTKPQTQNNFLINNHNVTHINIYNFSKTDWWHVFYRLLKTI